MKKTVLLLLSLTAFIFACSVELYGQSLLKKADKAFMNKDYYNAISLYKEVLNNEKDSVKIGSICFNIGEGYRLGNYSSEAEEWYEKAAENRYSGTDFYYNYANMLLINCNYDKAKIFLNKQLEVQPGDKKTLIKTESVGFALMKGQEQPVYEIKNMELLNSKYSDFSPALIKSRLIFASSRFEDKDNTKKYYTYTGQNFSDFYESVYDKGTSAWQAPEKLKGGINSKYNDGSIFYDDKNNTAYFMQCNGFSGKEANCNIYSSSFNDTANTWSEAKIFDYNSKEFSSGHPAFTSDGNTMFFVSDMNGGTGSKDIWMMKKNNNTWEQPVNLGYPINTEGKEMFPYVVGDTLLFYASDGNIGFGGLDIYYVKFNGDHFSEPVNMGTPFNSCSDDFGIIFLAKDSGMFCSNRQGGLGDDDIYSFSLIPVILSASGVITDKVTKKIIEGAIVTITGSDNSSDSTLSGFDGKYYFKNLRPDVKYTINVAKPGYLSDSKTLQTAKEKYSKNYCKDSGHDIDFELTPIISAEEEIVIPEIYYDFDKWDLRDTSKISLDKIIKMLNENPKIYIRINSHTDERGTEAYNYILSDNRAQSVVNYLIDKGIDPARLTSKGWGKSKHVIQNAQTEEEHQLNRRTTFSIVNANDMSSEYHKVEFKKIADKIRVKQELLEEKNKAVAEKTEKVATEDTNVPVSAVKEGIDFRVQFCASFKAPVEKNYYKKIEENISEFKVEYTKNDDGYYRYTIGSFTDYKDARQMEKRVKKLGYDEAFIVAYNNGVKIGIEELKKILKK